MTELSIREYGLLIQGKTANHSLQVAQVASPAAWEFLEGLAYSSDKNHRFIETASYLGQKAFRVINFVGVITTPDGTQIEILPKTSEIRQDSARTRALLWKMLEIVEDLPFLEATDASLMLRSQPLIETLITVFLHQATGLVRRGIHKDYLRIEADERFLRGQLRLDRQLRHPPGQADRFSLQYDVFHENRAENRLIHSALVQVGKWTRSNENQRLARELRFSFESIPLSTNHRIDFSLWRTTRDMIYYKPLLPWLKLILNQLCPFSLKGLDAGISFLFPMESLFERYVVAALRKQLEPLAFSLKPQLQKCHLSAQPKAFLLKPDLGIYCHGQLCLILDTKWKLIDRSTQYQDGADDPKAGIKQSDMYQLFAYGHKYFGADGGKLALIYPSWSNFNKPLPPFLGVCQRSCRVTSSCIQDGGDWGRSGLSQTSSANCQFLVRPVHRLGLLLLAMV